MMVKQNSIFGQLASGTQRYLIQCSMLAGHSGSKNHWHNVLELTHGNTTDINYKWKCKGYYVSPSVEVESGTTYYYIVL